jgi:hypothetical protein
MSTRALPVFPKHDPNLTTYVRGWVTTVHNSDGVLGSADDAGVAPTPGVTLAVPAL